MVKNLSANAGESRDTGLSPELGKSPAEGNGNPFQYPCLEKSHGQRSLVGYSQWGQRVRHNLATEHDLTGK